MNVLVIVQDVKQEVAKTVLVKTVLAKIVLVNCTIFLNNYF